MLHGGVVVPADVAHRHLLGSVLVFVNEEEPEREGLRRWNGAVHLVPHAMVDLEVLLDRVPWLLRNHQQSDAEPGHDLRRLG